MEQWRNGDSSDDTDESRINIIITSSSSSSSFVGHHDSSHRLALGRAPGASGPLGLVVFFFDNNSSNKLVFFFKVLDGFIFSVFIRAPSVRFTPNLM
jgi:hypothetical protein